jgi:hypothetical protein
MWCPTQLVVTQSLALLIEEITVEAHGADEQLSELLQTF